MLFRESFAWLVPLNGDHVALQLTRDVADDIAETIEPHWAEPADARALAARTYWLADGFHRPWGPVQRVIVLGFDGRSDRSDGARVDIAVEAEVGRVSCELSDRFNPWNPCEGPNRTAGSATTCWTLTVHARRHQGAADVDQVDCPEVLAALDPRPEAEPTLSPQDEDEGPQLIGDLPDDTADIVLDVLSGLAADADPAAAEAAVRDALAEHVDVAARRDGDELVVAAGIMWTSDCVVVVRQGDDDPFRFTDIRPIQLEKGEMGCGPGLYDLRAGG